MIDHAYCPVCNQRTVIGATMSQGSNCTSNHCGVVIDRHRNNQTIMVHQADGGNCLIMNIPLNASEDIVRASLLMIEVHGRFLNLLEQRS